MDDKTISNNNDDIKDSRDFSLFSPSVTSLPPNLENLKNVRRVFINNTTISDISSLKDLNFLTTFHFTNNILVKNFSSLAYLQGLISLDLHETSISDLNCIKNLIKLQELNISNTLIDSLDCLNGLVDLLNLNIIKTKVKSLVPIQNLVKIEKLFISECDIKDISPLGNLLNLKTVYMVGVPADPKRNKALNSLKCEFITYYSSSQPICSLI